MKLLLYPLMKTPAGRVPAGSPVAELSLDEGRTVISCGEGALGEKLGEIFSTPLDARVALGAWPEIFSWEPATLRPHTPAFFREIVYRLRAYGLFGVLEE